MDDRERARTLRMEACGIQISDALEARISQDFKNKVTLEILNAKAGAHELAKDLPTRPTYKPVEKGCCIGCGCLYDEWTRDCGMCLKRHTARNDKKPKTDAVLLKALAHYWHNW